MLNKTVKQYLIHNTLQNDYSIVLNVSKIANTLLDNTLSFSITAWIPWIK